MDGASAVSVVGQKANESDKENNIGAASSNGEKKKKDRSWTVDDFEIGKRK